MTLTTPRLLLRKPTLSDVDDYLEFVNSTFVMQYNAMTPVSREKAEKSFSNLPDDFSTVGIVLKSTKKLIGMIYVQQDSLRYGVASKEISYFLRAEEAQNGYMKEALSALMAYLFASERLCCITARCFAPNIASQRLLESLGFEKEGILRNCVKGYDDTVFDDCLYACHANSLSVK